MLSQLLGLIALPRCALCAAPCPPEAQLCGSCEGRLSGMRPRMAPVPGLNAAWSAGPYDGVARELVGALKFGARLAIARRVALAIAARAPADLLEGTIVPVPPAPLRRRWRGFDAAEAIAAAVGRETGLAVSRCLRRSQGRRQVGRPRAERLARPPRVTATRLAPPRAILVDDVLTTGATLAACARALRTAGAERVTAVTFARSE